MINRKSIYLTGINKLKILRNSQIIKKDELLINVDSCGICSSDLKFIKTGSRIKKFPIILGHEISGKIGKDKYIVFGAEIPCGKCLSCNKSKDLSNLCDNPLSVGTNFDGGFSNYFIIKKKILNRIPHIIYKRKKNLKYACISESLACVINGLEISNFKRNQTVGIIGAGYMGLLFVALAKLGGAKLISVIDYNKKRLNIAKSLGANFLYNIKKMDKKSLDNILKPTSKSGYDVVISATSNLKAHEFSCELVGKNGTVNLFGGIPKNLNKKLKIDCNFIHYRQAKITGSFSSNQKHLNKAFKIIKNNNIDFSKIITSFANFNNFKRKIKLLNKKKEIKCIFKPI